jgi:hypothetical protein
MRLINTATLKLEGPYMGSLPPYAILSHTWGDEELSLQQYTASEPHAQSNGFQKILSASAQAARDGLQYLWVDTVCIDKTSSAELSEAINSMFSWYLKAEACYVYLEDFDRDLEKCRWFTRGWTLQELLAPSAYQMTFFDSNWKSIGTKLTLRAQISEATLIDQACLTKDRSVWTFSVADRMSWVSRRETTRPEDIAYCLLGLFRVNMPLLYGEGAQRAFLRLQYEILQGTNDQTIFAWSVPSNVMSFCGALALSPKYFDARTSYRPTRSWDDKSWVAITKQGVTFRAKFRGHVRTGGGILLKCQRADSFETISFAIAPLMTGTNQFLRENSRLDMVPPERLCEFSKDVEITLRTDMFDISDFIHENPINYLAIVRQPSSESGYLPPERLRGAFDAQNAIEFVPLAATKLQGEIFIFYAADSSMTPFAVALYGFMENQEKERTISPSSSLRFASAYDIIGVYNYYAGQAIRYRHLRNAIEYHLCQDELPPNLNQLVPAERSVRDGLDVWTLAGGELVHVAVRRDIDPRLGFLGCARILAGTCWETHIKALADWGPLTSGSLDKAPSTSEGEEEEGAESSASAEEDMGE